MKKIHFILAALAAIIIASCGSKNSATEYDNMRLAELCNKYTSDNRLNDDEWAEFATLYSLGTDEFDKVSTEILSKVTPEMSIDDVINLTTESQNDFSALGEADGVVFDGESSGANPDILKRLAETHERKNQISIKLESDINNILNSSSKVDNNTEEVVTEEITTEKTYSISDFPKFAEEFAKKIRKAKTAEEFLVLSDIAHHEFEQYLKACKNEAETEFVRQNYYPLESALIEVGEDINYSDDDGEWE